MNTPVNRDNRRLLREPGYRARSLKMGSPSRSVSHWLTQFHNGEKSWGIQKREAAEKRLIRGMSRIRVWFQSSDGVDDSERARRRVVEILRPRDFEDCGARLGVCVSSSEFD